MSTVRNINARMFELGFGWRPAEYLGTRPDGRMYLEVRYSSHQGRKLVRPEKVELYDGVIEHIVKDMREALIVRG